MLKKRIFPSVVLGEINNPLNIISKFHKKHTYFLRFVKKLQSGMGNHHKIINIQIQSHTQSYV